MAKYDSPRISQLYIEEVPHNLSIEKFKYKVTKKIGEKVIYTSKLMSFSKNKTFLIKVDDASEKVQADLYLNDKWFKGYILRHYKSDAEIKFDKASLKSTQSLNSEDENKIKDVYLKSQSDCGYIILMSFEVISDFLNRIYQNKPTADDYRVFRLNNSHIDFLQSGNLNEKLRPGQVIIISHSLISANNSKLKAMKDIALRVEQELAIHRKDPRFDERFHAIHNELLISILMDKNISLEGVISEAEYRKSLALASIKYDNNGCVIGEIDLDNYELPSVNFGYETTNAFFLTAEQLNNYEQKYNARIELNKQAHLNAMNRYNRLAELAEQYQKKRGVTLSNNFTETSRFIQANKYSIDALGEALKSKFLDYEVRKDYMRLQDLLIKGSGVIGTVEERLYVYEKMIKHTTGLSTAVRLGGKIMLMWTAYEAGKTVYSATKKNNNMYTRKIIFVETSKAEAAIVAGAAGAAAGRGLVTVIGLNPYGRAGQVVMTVLGMGSAAGASIMVDKALFKSMGLCK
ncbi:hypothetical protein [Acinetobacter bereziniae]|uniref:hypothetical protein n=1 Tax=Acinetobacter bereziniae TaxID=106648 RepID=UPI0030097201